MLIITPSQMLIIMPSPMINDEYVYYMSMTATGLTNGNDLYLRHRSMGLTTDIF